MKLLDQEQSIRQQIFDYFGYQEGCRVLPFDDARHYVWRTDGIGYVFFADTLEELNSSEGNSYRNNLRLTGYPVSKAVYRGVDFTMISVDTQTDGNDFLQIFTNANERP